MKKLLKICLSVLIALSICSCTSSKKDIVILFTNDVHCGIDDNIGYAGLVAYKKEMLEKTPYVSLVDAGDAVQGSSLASVSNGEAMVECLNIVGYDVLTFGNHEFDYGVEQLDRFMRGNTATYVSANIHYSGSNQDHQLNNVAKYKILTYGNTKVAYIGVTTPNTIKDIAPTNILENGQTVIDFFGGKTEEQFYNTIQEVIDEVKNYGAHYVVVLAHMGDTEDCEPYTSINLAKNTSGIDVIVDAHSHSAFTNNCVADKENHQVLISSTGTKLASIGQIVITSQGIITTTTISNYANKDEETKTKIEEVSNRYLAALKETIFKNPVATTITDENSIRIIRSREMGIGDLIADSFRNISNADIALVNGGGIKNGLPEGNVSYNDLINIMPYGNTVCLIQMSGQQLVDYLEYSYQFTNAIATKDGKAYGEFGSFMQVSGLKLTINTSITSCVEVDSEDNFVAVGQGKRRVENVLVLQEDGSYAPIDLEKQYRIAMTDYAARKGGSGMKNVLSQYKALSYDIMEDYRCIATYVCDVLKCDVSNYTQPQGRITIK